METTDAPKPINIHHKVVMTDNQIRKKIKTLNSILKKLEKRQNEINSLQHNTETELNPILDRLVPLLEKFAQEIKAQLKSIIDLKNSFLALRVDYQKLYNKHHREVRIAYSQLKKFQDTLFIRCPFKNAGQHNNEHNCILCDHKTTKT